VAGYLLRKSLALYRGRPGGEESGDRKETARRGVRDTAICTSKECGNSCSDVGMARSGRITRPTRGGSLMSSLVGL
jgi:hypothetical protein